MKFSVCDRYNNAFTYCCNSPIDQSDDSGCYGEDFYWGFIWKENAKVKRKNRDNKTPVNVGTSIVMSPDIKNNEELCYGGYYQDGETFECYLKDEDVILWYGDDEAGLQEFKKKYLGDLFDENDKTIAKGNGYPGITNAAINMLIRRYEELTHKKGDDLIVVHGQFSYATDVHLRTMQRKLGVKEDGIFGPETWKLLCDEIVKNGVFR